jgi:hypothetical protein
LDYLGAENSAGVSGGSIFVRDSGDGGRRIVLMAELPASMPAAYVDAFLAHAGAFAPVDPA